MSRLTDRLALAEGELGRLKRSCQFTALAEILAAGEEYAHEVYIGHPRPGCCVVHPSRMGFSPKLPGIIICCF